MQRNALMDRLESCEPADRVVLLMEHAKQLFRDASGQDWLIEFDKTCGRVTTLLTYEQWRVLASDLAWWVRQRRSDDGPDRSPAANGTPVWQTPAVALLVTAQFLRYDFRFDDLDRYLRTVDSPDALLDALHAFSRLGAGKVVAPDEIEAIRSAPDADSKVLQCLLHAMCMSPNPAAWGPLIVEIGDELERTMHRPDGVLYYRRAIGHRVTGHLDRADADMRKALSFLPPDNSVHQQYHGELSTIASERLLQTQLETQEATFIKRLEEVRNDTLEAIQATLRAGLTANFQILTIFLTLAGFVGTAGATVLRLAEDKITWQRGIATLSLLLIFTFLVFIGSQVLISGKFSRSKRK